MGLKIKSKDGKQGEFDASAYLQTQVPGAVVTGYDKATGQINFKAGEKTGSFDARSMLSQAGAEITDVGELNKPEQALDSSPLSWKERFELGYLTRESSDFQRLISNVGTLFGGKPMSDEAIAANEKRALGQLKKRYGDAKVVNGELVVKHEGVWKKVDSSSDSIGEDAAQLLGNSGLNLMGAIAGGTFGASLGMAGGPLAPLTVPVAGAIGAVAGSVLGEVAEEATAVGIVGGEIDPAGTARDLLTEATLGLVGESVGGLMAKGASKLAGPGLEAATKAAEVKAEATVVKGMSKVAATADSKVKDTIAQTYATINPELSEAPLREAIDSAENMAKAHAYSKVARVLPTDAPNPLLRDMATSLQDSLDKAYELNFKNLDGVLKKIQNTVTDDFKIDLEQTVIDLKAAAKDAPRDKRAFFNSLENETIDLVKGFKSSGEEPALKGKKAWAYTQRMYKMIHQKLKDVGAYEKQQQIDAGDRMLFNSMEKIRSYYDSTIMAAADFSNLTPEFEAQRKQFRDVADMLGTIWSKSFSNKRDLSFAQNVAKGKVDPNVTEALVEINRLIPDAGVQSTLSDMRIKQAGIEMTPLFKVPDLVRSAAAGTAAISGGVPGAVAAATVVSPRFASTQARAVARGSEMLTKNRLAQALPQARSQARSLLGLAYTSGFVRTLNQSSSRALLTNPDLFNQFVNQSTQLSSSLAEASEEKVTDAAVRAAGVK